ncbi:MAG: carbon storage regulator CsrA [Campylobacterota bacterium]|nr:carbon storage regulator CsrA [Campylobacterota bacterium]
MLILSRKPEESIVINENVTIKIVSVEKGVVKLGIDAPRDVQILRSELIEAVESSNKEASLKIDENLLSAFYKKFKK